MSRVMEGASKEGTEMSQDFWPNSDMSRPDPNISNCGLVIVQVDAHHQEEVYQPPAIITWTPPPDQPAAHATGNAQTGNGGGSSAAHQLIHGLPPKSAAQVQKLHPVDHEDESVDESVDEEEIEEADGNVSDEGYRTHSSGQGSPATESPSPKVDVARKSVVPQTDLNRRGLKQNEGDGIGGSSLMWLLDFKLDFFNEGGNNNGGGQMQQQQFLQQLQVNTVQLGEQMERSIPSLSPAISSVPQEQQEQQQIETVATVDVETSREEFENNAQEDKSASEEAVSKSSDLTEVSPSPKEFRGISTRKPPYTYTDLITQALKDKTALTVSGIYQWITDNFPYFKAEDDRWKNSVRHNLSMNPHFRKGDKSKHGAGHLWVMADIEEGAGGEVMEGGALFGAADGLLMNDDDDETARAVRSILGQEAANQAAEAAKAAESLQAKEAKSAGGAGGQRNAREMAATTRQRAAMAAAKKEADKENRRRESQVMSGQKRRFQQMQKSAEEIVKGVQRSMANSVEVQYVSKAESGIQAPFPDSLCPSPSKRLHEMDSSPTSSLISTATSSASTSGSVSAPTIFSPMEQMEELDVVAAYCYDEDVASLEKALGIDFQDPHKELLAK